MLILIILGALFHVDQQLLQNDDKAK